MTCEGCEGLQRGSQNLYVRWVTQAGREVPGTARGGAARAGQRGPHSEGPRGVRAAGPFADGTDVRAASVPRGGAGGVRRWFGVPVGDAAHNRRSSGLDQWQFSCGTRHWGGASYASCWMRHGPRNRFGQFWPWVANRRSAPGVPGADRSFPGDRAAVPCRPVTVRSEVPRRTAPSVRLIAPAVATRGSFGPAPGWHGHRDQRSPERGGHAPYG